jgi:hypothetical protein
MKKIMIQKTKIIVMNKSEKKERQSAEFRDLIKASIQLWSVEDCWASPIVSPCDTIAATRSSCCTSSDTDVVDRLWLACVTLVQLATPRVGVASCRVLLCTCQIYARVVLL